MLQGLFGFVLGAIIAAVLLSYQPQLIGDFQQGLHDLAEGTRHFSRARDDIGVVLTRPFSGERRNGGEFDNSSDRGVFDDSEQGIDHDRRDQRGPRGGDDWRSDSSSSGNAFAIGDDQDARWNQVNQRGGGDLSVCRGELEVENRGSQPVRVRLDTDHHAITALTEGDVRFDLAPGAHGARKVKIETTGSNSCDDLDSNGALTLDAEICPLSDGTGNPECTHEDVGVETNHRSVADISVPDRRSKERLR